MCPDARPNCWARGGAHEGSLPERYNHCRATLDLATHLWGDVCDEFSVSDLMNHDFKLQVFQSGGGSATRERVNIWDVDRGSALGDDN